MIPRYLVNFDLAELEKKKTDFLVIGSGVAGLVSTLNLAEAGKVTMLTKEEPQDCSTEHAQGGIAAVIAEDDSFELHYQDTLKAGAGLANPKAVELLVEQGQQRIKELLKLGVSFDRQGKEVALTKEGAHSRRRILYAGGDATGTELRNTLTKEVLAKAALELHSNIFVIDLLTKNNRCYGVLAYDSNAASYQVYLASAVLLATGGAGQLYQKTSNPEVATGDGIALAYRAGVEVMDLEFIQFHPTTLSLAGAANFLISEAVRGEGAVLRNQQGERFMFKYHQLGELAPRDVAARAIYQEMKAKNSNCVYLDLTELDADFIKERFPTIYKACLSEGLDITKDYIPVVPAAHYCMGGIKTDTKGATNIQGLFACGETAALGVHGANRLASNSLLEGLVYGKRVAEEMINYTKDSKLAFDNLRIANHTQQFSAAAVISIKSIKKEIKELMTTEVAIIREEVGLSKVQSRLEELFKYLNYEYNSVKDFEIQNMLIVAYLVVKAALLREESRGAHYRRDFPEPSSNWLKHIVLEKDREWEELELEFT
ncbi:L-aspartate oxidase [Fuchsiella alkaliacetigena]|uniref:L-aspartate oxidase n=1 Tax=Fuchsiella alkaliacetigena TaxID=957042 RepID=UPI00200A7359|nr:L-aspartate oxidase [Fuchsiella alkaliacetigena]MCK8823904.1 L-aspartate oxidase [Fuchsiella alkaliacetigena]